MTRSPQPSAGGGESWAGSGGMCRWPWAGSPVCLPCPEDEALATPHPQSGRKCLWFQAVVRDKTYQADPGPKAQSAGLWPTSLRAFGERRWGRGPFIRSTGTLWPDPVNYHPVEQIRRGQDLELEFPMGMREVLCWSQLTI